jgi:large subunit ribosomal protein L4
LSEKQVDKEANFILPFYHIFLKMSSIKIYNLEGKEVSELELNKAVFGLPLNADLTHQAVIVALANQRQVLAATKDRSQVRGGGKKPWRQKGTGRARHGSIRSPLWRHGGITFGPTKERNFKLKINKKMARKALLIVLSSKVKDGELIVLDELKVAVPKTKEMAKIMANFPQIKNGLLVLPDRRSLGEGGTEKNEDIKRAARNLPNLNIININNLNILDILKYQYLIFTKDGIEYLNKKYSK